MWYAQRISREADPGFVASTTDLLQSTLRTLIITAGVIFLIWYLVAIAGLGWQDTIDVIALIFVIVGLTSMLALRLLTGHFMVALSLWLLGLAGTITVAAILLEQPEIAFGYALLPLAAAVTAGWPAGLLAESLVIALVGWLSRGGLSSPLPTSFGWAIIAAGAFAGALGWAATGALLTVAQWAVFSYKKALQTRDEALDQRVELKQAREDLIQANQELARLSDRFKAMHQAAEEARRVKEEFVANVSHELRTPLNMIIGFSEMITQSPQLYGGRLPPELMADITAIQRNSRHLSRLVDDVLDLSQIEAGRMALSKEWVSLEKIIDEATLAVGALYVSKGLYLEKEIISDLPPVFCDSTRIHQVLLNLLSNAGRFTDRGGVRIKAWREADDVLVSITDTGPGVAAEDHGKLFEPFQQLDSSIRRRHSGSGLGLSISKQFVEMHGGKMWLDSEVGVGTTFDFSLPLATPLPRDLTRGDAATRWFHPYREYVGRTRRSKAPLPHLPPRFVVLETGNTAEQLFSRHADDVEIVFVHNIDAAKAELNRAPAQALIVNTSPFEEAPFSKDQLANLPYDTCAVTCWIPGMDEAARRLGVVHYLMKPVKHEMVLATLNELGEDVRTVLLVDDEPEVLQLFTRMLASEEHGYRVLQATSGRRALRLLRERQPDVMLLDLIMPGMDGFQVLQAKSQDAVIQDIPVVVITSRDPASQPIVSDTLTVTRGGGLSMRDLLACTQAVSAALSRQIAPDGRGSPGMPAA